MDREQTYQEKIARSLGSANSYAVKTDKFDANLLNPIPRKDARDDWSIKSEDLKGFDTWHCHEATFLTDLGIPVAGTLKFCYQADSKDMIESKSMKLYLNSFDMCKMGKGISEATIYYENQVKTDLSRVLDTEVDVKFHESSHENGVDPFIGYIDLHKIVLRNQLLLNITDYEGRERHFKLGTTRSEGYHVFKGFTNVLRSRCRHTKQKDTGTAFFHIETEDHLVDVESLFKEVVALREVNEFHEFCCEKLYTTIMSTKGVKKCMVALLYSRRGSLDINPVRLSHPELSPKVVRRVDIYTNKVQGQ